MAFNKASIARRQRERARQQQRREKEAKRRERREIKKLDPTTGLVDPTQDPNIDWGSAVRETEIADNNAEFLAIDGVFAPSAVEGES